MVKFKPKDIGIKKEHLKKPLESTFEKVKDLDQQGKNRVMQAMWQGIGPLKGFGKGFDEVQNNLNKLKVILKNKENKISGKLKKRILESWSTGIGVSREQKIENTYFRTIINELFENIENQIDNKRNKEIIQELETDLKKSRDEMQFSLARKLQIIRKPKA